MQDIYSILSNLKNNEKNDYLKPNKFDYLSSNIFFFLLFMKTKLIFFLFIVFPILISALKYHVQYLVLILLDSWQ